MDNSAVSGEDLETVVGKDAFKAVIGFYNVKLVDYRSLFVPRGPGQDAVGDLTIFLGLNDIISDVGDVRGDFYLDLMLL